ncbi:hypothetical protein [Bacillus toyonensis]|uniref:Uncharacterized protein n=1 Tax=Bacillus toyonensis TaxID=155322 RepID=A0A2A8H8E7_9BACI|nr:hypothetical protein [Bacillus toyonensis]PEP91965.1 hypothetical protein CN585_27695 [Bacillus toyonensis]
MLQDQLVLSILLLFVALLVISNHVVWKFSKNNQEKRIQLGLIFILIFTPLAIAGVASGIAYIGVDGIGRGVPSLFAGTVTALNGLYIIFKRE